MQSGAVNRSTQSASIAADLCASQKFFDSTVASARSSMFPRHASTFRDSEYADSGFSSTPEAPRNQKSV
jgi:hypothetical protein